MTELSIHIHIAGRTYPLTVKPEEEGNLRAAGKLIQEKLQVYNEQFNLRDQQDALAMFALEIANENLALRKELATAESETEKELEQTEKLLGSIRL